MYEMFSGILHDSRSDFSYTVITQQSQVEPDFRTILVLSAMPKHLCRQKAPSAVLLAEATINHDSKHVSAVYKMTRILFLFQATSNHPPCAASDLCYGFGFHLTQAYRLSGWQIHKRVQYADSPCHQTVSDVTWSTRDVTRLMSG